LVVGEVFAEYFNGLPKISRKRGREKTENVYSS
jgi:hypothetical protein